MVAVEDQGRVKVQGSQAGRGYLEEVVPEVVKDERLPVGAQIAA